MLEHYQITRQLGQGGSGKTFLALAQQHSPSIACVVKQILPSDAIATIGPCLQDLGEHPHLPTFLGWFTEAGQGYLVQEYIAGPSLADRLATVGQFTTDQICLVLEQVLTALAFLHRQQIIHGDLKPENLRYRPLDHPAASTSLILVDLPGLSLTDRNPEYAAPEQLRGQAAFASDLYSLGATCIHLLTDLHPFDLIGNDGRFVWRSYWQANPRDQATASTRTALANLLDRLVQPDLAERLPSATAALQVMTQSGLKAPPPSHPGVTSLGSPDATPPPSPWKCIATLTGHNGLFATVNAVACHPDGQLIISGSDDKTIRLWDVAISQETTCLTGHTGFVKAIACHRNGSWFVSGSTDRTVRIWSLPHHQSLALLSGLPASVQAVCPSLDGEVVAIGSTDRTIRLWDWTRNQVSPLLGHTLGVTALAFSPDGQLLASASQDRTIRLWDWHTGQCQQTLKDHTWPVRAIAFSPDGRYLASGGDDNQIHLWTLANQQKLTISGHSWAVSGLGFSLDGKILVSSSWDKTLKLWDVNTGRELAVLLGHTDAISGLAISSQGTIVSCGKDKTIRVWMRVDR